MSSNEFGGPTEFSTGFGSTFAVSVVGVSTSGGGLKKRYVKPVAATVPATNPARRKFRRLRYTCSGVISLGGGSGKFFEAIKLYSLPRRFRIKPNDSWANSNCTASKKPKKVIRKRAKNANIAGIAYVKTLTTNLFTFLQKPL